MIPKTSVNVMGCEVSRLLTVQGSNIVPVSVKIPRKQMYDFQADLYPEAQTYDKVNIIPNWLNGIDCECSRKSLNPKAQTTKEPEIEKLLINAELPTEKGVVFEPVTAKVALPKHTPFRHLITTSKLKWEDIKMRPLNASNQAEVFQFNERFFAFQTQGPGGRLSLVSRNTQRVGEAPCLINGYRALH